MFRQNFKGINGFRGGAGWRGGVGIFGMGWAGLRWTGIERGKTIMHIFSYRRGKNVDKSVLVSGNILLNSV